VAAQPCQYAILVWLGGLTWDRLTPSVVQYVLWKLS
jgi:hypothetical protein